MTLDIAILAGYEQGPFFYTYEGAMENWSAEAAGEHLGLSAGLVRDLTVWDDEWQNTLDLADGRNSGFDTDEEKHEWIERGKALAIRIKQESPLVASVDYQANGYYEDGTCVF
ncbi:MULTISPECIES: hypothetical protein [Actinoalloteichus]|uniref:Uncharacterized protein n=1 Tax=Actinoalloteichus fjordicus TaxID=1612552 RepID=A0AAC9LES7_9PSEU|nr:MULTISPECIES: hypothetical protein [Actinoalloteichus]APU16061.1 hypothetical protein UA74_20180 [Actinoalloteichus fjordicus]APU22126.1 hypothetical protein UA75_20685 [Actinoalloteichus sp. GBA129-24]